MTKKEKVVDLKPKAEKISEEQYGTVNINIEDGRIKYEENGEANKKD